MMSKDPRLRGRLPPSRSQNGSSSSPSSTPPTPTTTTTPVAPNNSSSTRPSTTSALPSTSQSQAPEQSHSRGRYQSAHPPSSSQQNSQHQPQARYYQQENRYPPQDDQRAREERRNQPQQNGYQDPNPRGPVSTRQDMSSSTASHDRRQRSRSRGRSPTAHMKQSRDDNNNPASSSSAPNSLRPNQHSQRSNQHGFVSHPPPPGSHRRTHSDYQPRNNDRQYGHADQHGSGQYSNNHPSEQSINKSNARQWELPMPGPPKMTGSGMQPSGTVTPGTRYRNPFEKNAAAAAAAAGASAPHTYPGSYQGFQQGGYSGGRPPNQTANRGSPSGRDTSLSSPSPSIATDGDRSRAPVARNRSRSRSRPPVPPHQQYPAEPVRPPPSVSAAPPPRERGRSKSVARSKSQSRARSRARSKSRYRSLSRPVRQAISAGTYERTHRSPSRSKRGRYDYSDSSSEDSGSDSDYYERSRRRKRRRRYSSSEDDSSFLDDSEYSDDDVTEVDANGDRTRVDTTNFTPAERVNGPMLDMMSELKRLTDRYSEREEKQRRTHKRIRRITKQLSSEVRGLRKEIAGRPAGDQAWDSRSAAQPTQSMPPPRQSKPSTPRSTPRSTPQHTPPPGQNARPGHRAQQEGELVSLEYADQRPGTSRSRASTWSGAALGAPGGQEPLRPPPSLIPASAGVAVKTEDDRDDTLSLNRRHRRRMTGDGQMADPAAPSSSSSGGPPLPSSPPPPTGPNYATDPARSVGPRRVFDRATYDLPIGNQQLMSVISLGGASEGERVGSGRNPRPMVLNPFSRGTAFEDIAVVNSLDGMIMFWDIRAQRKVAEIAPKLSRVIPYAETLTWVSEDTLVAVSHLKYGLSWSDPKPVTDATATTADGLAPDPDRFSRPETQTNLITVFWNRDGSLKYKVFTIHGHPHDKPILNVCAVMGEHDQSMGYVTGGNDKHLIHWRFTRLEDGGFIGGGMVDVHKLHTNAIMCTMYSHTSKRFYSGGLDGRYIVYDMEHMQVIHNEKPGKFVHLLQNPADPRIHAAVKVEPQHQLFLMDERVPGQKVLTLDNHGTNAVSKSTHPSWHTEGGLLCSGTDVDGMINIWDVRWAGMRHTENERPGYGVVTADLSANGIQSARASVDDPAYLDLQHPIFWPGNRPSRTHHSRSSSSRKGGPSQVLDVGGKKVGQALFHPTRNVMMVQSFDSTLTFIDYNMINKSIV